ncbi:MAG: 4-(cytidine 5'-diphospho)-2-C-methyl-D-erythritol kinase [Dehalococcoidia bacterium]|nr:4-(cytidine 5'-diphospho)-2-C-methyl-D-erythritol kinase [Dehalococcoidia bacterium]
MLILRAPAKVNLVLEVLGKRNDGYHEIRTILQTVDLCDTLKLELADTFHFECPVEALQGLENLVVRAARLLAEAAGVKSGVSITLDKRIPWGVGLGGGSSDAAACLLGLNRLWGLNMSVDQLRPIGERLGSDVPFFLYGGTCLVEGKGERVLPLPDLLSPWVVLLVPYLPVVTEKTRRMYQSLTQMDMSDGNKVEVVYRRLTKGEPVSSDLLFNAFERMAQQMFPGLTAYWQQFETAAREKVLLCGSGPALFSLHPTKEAAETVVSRLKERGIEANAVRCLGRAAGVVKAGSNG